MNENNGAKGRGFFFSHTRGILIFVELLNLMSNHNFYKGSGKDIAISV